MHDESQASRKVKILLSSALGPALLLLLFLLYVLTCSLIKFFFVPPMNILAIGLLSSRIAMWLYTATALLLTIRAFLRFGPALVLLGTA